MGKLAALSPLVGRWVTTIRMLYPADQKGKSFQAEDIYRWLPGENILIHEVSGEMGGNPVNSIELYSSDGSEGVFVRSFDSSGEVSDYTASMRDDVWRIDGDVQRFSSTGLVDGAIEGLWQVKIGDTWNDWMTVSLKRQQ
jgi:Protein of unknown function (DUF1579)